MTRNAWATIATLCTVLALGACSSARFGTPTARAAAPTAPVQTLPPEPIEAVPSGPVTSAPLPPVEGGVLAPPAGQPGVAGSATGTDIASLPPAGSPAPAAPSASRMSVVGGWTARDASGASCRVQLSSSPALDLYRASASGCANRDLARVTAWDFRDGEVYLYQPGGAVAARLRASGSAMSGVLAKSGAPLSLSR